MLQYRNVNWLQLLLASRGSFSPGVPRRVMTFGLIAIGVYWADREGLHVRLPVAMYEVAGAVLALLLAFRTNTGYARFWEGRGLWGSIVNATRNVSRIAKVHGRDDAATAREIAAWATVFAHASRVWLRGQPLLPDARRLLPPAEAEAVSSAPHPPIYAAEQLSLRIRALQKAGALEPLMAHHAEREVMVLIDDIGGCEKILKTPTPLSFVVLIQRFIALFLATFPFSVIGRVGAFTPLVTMAVAYPLLMVDALGGELDDPFGHNPNDLPLSRICATIERNLITEQRDLDEPSDGVPLVE